MTGTHGARVRGNLAALLEQSAAVVRGSASLPALITARIDRLRPSQQLTLKVPSKPPPPPPSPRVVAVIALRCSHAGTNSIEGEAVRGCICEVPLQLGVISTERSP